MITGKEAHDGEDAVECGVVCTQEGRVKEESRWMKGDELSGEVEEDALSSDWGDHNAIAVRGEVRGQGGGDCKDRIRGDKSSVGD